mgnify:CR=1 FL=1
MLSNIFSQAGFRWVQLINWNEIIYICTFKWSALYSAEVNKVHIGIPSWGQRLFLDSSFLPAVRLGPKREKISLMEWRENYNFRKRTSAKLKWGSANLSMKLTRRRGRSEDLSSLVLYNRSCVNVELKTLKMLMVAIYCHRLKKCNRL